MMKFCRYVVWRIPEERGNASRVKMNVATAREYYLFCLRWTSVLGRVAEVGRKFSGMYVLSSASTHCCF